MNYFADEFRRRLESRRDIGGAQAPDLAKRADFRLGAATVRPSVRTINGPTGSSTAEPRVMQVLLALADAGGRVLTREDLIESCWNGQVVSDDSISRAIAEIRRIGRATSAGFTVETIPRIGYRLAGPVKDAIGPSVDDQTRRKTLVVSRRGVMAGALGVLALAGLGLFYSSRSRIDPEAAALRERGRQALRDELPSSDAQGVGFLRRAVAIEPEDAESWGLLSLALRNAVEHSDANKSADAVRECESAARRALALNPGEGNALTALATMQPAYGDWGTTETRLKRVLELAPDNLPAIAQLGIHYQSSGYEAESEFYNATVATRDPLSPPYQFRRAWKLWGGGRVADADRVIDRALQLFPTHPAVWNTRMMLFALSGRPRAALDMVEDESSRPATMRPPAVANWRLTLNALATRDPADIERARQSMFSTVTRNPGSAINAIMILSVLGQIDAAFAVADGYLLRRGSVIAPLRPDSGQIVVNDQRWRKTMMLFTPAVAAMQADPRFMNLCWDIGLVTYWRARGVRPDFMNRNLRTG